MASSTPSFNDAALPRRYCPSVVMTSLALRVVDAGPQRGGGEPGEHHRVHGAQPRTGQHRDDGLGHHRHVDGHPVAGLQAEFGEGVGSLGHLVLELRVGDVAGVADGLALPVDGDAVSVAGLDVAVDAVVGDVELAADEPLGDGCLGPVEHLGEGGVPASGALAWVAQKANRSASASSYNASVALASAANSAGGGYEDWTSTCVSVMTVRVVTQRCNDVGNSHPRLRAAPVARRAS